MSVERWLSRLLALLLLAVVALPAIGWCADSGEVSAPPGKPSTLRFRRVYAPANREKEWPRGNVRYLPMAPDEFERLLKTVRGAAHGAPTSPATAVAAAEYEARLDGDQLVDGQGTLHVEHCAEGRALLPLDPCGLAIGKAAWAADPPQPATLGLGLEGKLQLLVEQSGRLQLDWSLRGHRDESGTVTFQCEFPPCPAIRLTLDLPEDATLSSDQGIVLQKAKIEPGRRRWQIELGGHHSLKLHVAPPERPDASRTSARVRHSLVYDFSERGVEVSAQLLLDAHREPLRRLSLTLDPELQLVTALCGERSVPWSVTSDGPDQATQVVLEFPEPIQGMGQKLQLGALAPLVMGRPWRLPRIRPAGVFWEEGNATLLVPAPLLIEQLVPIRCRQSRTGPLPAPRSGESMELQYVAADATVEITLTRPKAPVQVRSGTTIELSGGQTTAQVLADFHVADSGRFLLQADVAREWIIDSVESIPEGVVDDWNLEAASKGSQKLAIRLAKALALSRPVRLSVAARRLRSPLGRSLAVDDLVPLRFLVGGSSKRLVAVRAAEPYQLRLSGTDQLTRIDPDRLDNTELELFAEVPRDLLFEHDTGVGGLRVSLEKRRPRYTAELRVEATVAEGSLLESYRLRCHPDAARVDRVLVRFSHTRPAPPHWTLGADDDQQLVSRRLSPDELAAADLSSEGETWEIVLQRPRSVAFEIRATRVSKLTDRQSISLVSLPEATDQEGVLVVRSSGSVVVQVEDRQLKSIPAEAVPADRHQTNLATYRYDPSQQVAGGSETLVSVSPHTAENRPPSAWSWSCRLESRYETDGNARHVAVYPLQNFGCERLHLQLPPSVTFEDVLGVWIDASRFAWKRGEGEQSGCLVIDLPPGTRFAIVAMHFATKAPRLGVIRSLAPPWPKADIPVLARRWTAWLPPGYASLDTDPRWQSRHGKRLTWTQRLFGPLGRAAETGWFDPLSAQNWSTLIGYQPSRLAAQRKVEQLMQLLGALASRATGKQPDSLDWGSLLTDRSVDQLEPMLLVDRQALAQLGLTPHSPVRPVSADTPIARGIALLERAQLAIMVHADAIVLTSAIDAVLNRGDLEPLENKALWWVLPGPLADQLEQAAEGNLNHPLMPAAAWNQTPAESEMPWATTALAGYSPNDFVGWTAYRPEASGTDVVRLQIFHRDTLRTLRWATFLLVVALVWWRAADRPMLLAIFAGLFGVAALLVPAVYVPACSGAWLGTLFCLAVRLLQRKRPADGSPAPLDPKPDHLSPATVATQAGILIVVMATMLALCASVRGAEDNKTASKPPTRPEVYQVFIPVDEQQQPTGGKYQVPEEFHNELHRRARALAEEPRGWLLSAATYRGVLAWQGTPPRLVPAELKASFDLHVFGQAVRVRLPFEREHVNLLPGGTLLDGRAIQPEWDKEGGALLFNVPKPGQYCLELSFQPTIHESEAAGGFDLATARLANSRLELGLPPNAPAIQVPSALGTITGKDHSSRILAQLGPTDGIVVRWPSATGGDVAGPALDLEQFLWLKVRPGSVVLDAKLKFKILQGHVERFRLVADPRLRLLPSRDKKSPTAEIHAEPGQPQTIQLELAEPVADQASIEISLLLKGASGVGSLRLPQLEVLDARTTKRWMAVSVDPALEHEEHDSGQLQALAVPDFAAAWGTVDAQPSFAYVLTAGEPAWSMSTHPRKPHTTVNQALALSFGKKDALVRFDAELLTTVGYNFQYRLLAPASLEVQSISVLEEGVERMARWSRAADGSVTVFLTGPVAGKQKLSLEGRLPTPGRGEFQLPALQVVDCELQTSGVELFRQPAVLVDLAKTVGLVESEASPVYGNDPELGRLVVAFSHDGTGPADATLVVSPNRPKLTARQITSLRRHEESWQATVDVQLGIAEGVLDEIRLDVPPQLNGPYQVNTPAALKVIDRPGGAMQLVVRPRSAVKDQYRFAVSSKVNLAAGERVSVPNVSVPQVKQPERLLVLPGRLRREQIAWETRGLDPISLPKDFAEVSAELESPAAYRVVGEDFQAVLTSPDRTRGKATIHLADVRIAWQTDGSCQGVASFDLVPAAQSHCSLHMPDGYHLVHVFVAGVPTTPLPDGDPATTNNRYRIPLGSRAWPQRIEILFTARLPEPDPQRGRRFDAPRLGTLPVARMLWTISAPSQHAPQPPANARITTPAEHELLRLNGIARLIERGSNVAAEAPDEKVRWYRTWIDRFLASRDRLRRYIAEPERADSARTVRRELETTGRRQREIAQRLGTAELLARLSAKTPVAGDPAELWLRTLDRPNPTTQCTLETETGSLFLVYSRADSDPLSHRLAGALGLVLVILVAGVGIGRGLLTNLLCRWPHLLGVVAGLAWWLWLSPSVLGWAIVLVSLVASFRSGWRLPRQHDSTIVHLG